MNPVLRRLRGPFAVHVGGTLATALWFGPAVVAAPPPLTDPVGILAAQLAWAVLTAPYTVTAAAWAWRPDRPGVVGMVIGVGVLGGVSVAAGLVELVAAAGEGRADGVACIGCMVSALQGLLALAAVLAAVTEPPGPAA